MKRKKGDKKRRTGKSLIAAGALVLFGAMGAAVGWEHLAGVLGGVVAGVVATVGGGVQFLVLLGLVLLASGATVLVVQRA